ncbi:hypothetical protein SD81_038510 [Tolypothrix campylonemoides VB511288]|nr:hypothetical protein SD81_038510 [Tolypothrix campylonemoides VB511288]
MPFGQYWENVLRPLAKERQRENARRLNQSNDSNLNHSLDESNSQLKKGKRVIQEVSDNLSTPKSFAIAFGSALRAIA